MQKAVTFRRGNQGELDWRCERGSSRAAIKCDQLKAPCARSISIWRSQVEKYAEAPAYSGKLTVEQFNPRALMQALELAPVQTADPSVLSSAAANFGVRGTASSVSLEPLRLTLDQTNVSGRLGIADFSRSALRFDLDVDGIDVDRYLAPVKEEAKAASPGGAAAGATEIPVETLRALDIDGKAKIGKLKISKLNMANVRATVKANNGVVNLSPLEQTSIKAPTLGISRSMRAGQRRGFHLTKTSRGCRPDRCLRICKAKKASCWVRPI